MDGLTGRYLFTESEISSTIHNRCSVFGNPTHVSIHRFRQYPHRNCTLPPVNRCNHHKVFHNAVAEIQRRNQRLTELDNEPSTYSGVKSIEDIRRKHTQIIKSGNIPILYNKIIHAYAKSGSLEDARRVFDKMPERNISSWGHIIAGYSQHGYGQEVLKLFCLLQNEGTELNKLIITSVVHACTNLDDIEQGKQVHARIVKGKLDSGVGIGTALVTMYVKCGSLEDARKAFDRIHKPNLVSWSAMIGGYAQNEQGEEALQLFSAMKQHSGLKPNHFTFGSVLSALTALEALEQGKEVHAHVIKTGFDIDVYIGSNLLNMYVKCGNIGDAFKVFEDLPTRNVVSWTAMIAGFSQSPCGEEALKLFFYMQLARLKPNQFTYSSVLSACSARASLGQGRRIHGQVVKNGFQSYLSVGTALIKMYASCGMTEDAISVFETTSEQSVVSWTTMIVGYTQNGQCEEALKLYIKMQREGVSPNQFTFASILSACASVTNLGQGKELHACIAKTRFQSNLTVGNALVTMYAKCGSIEDAHDAFHQLPDRDLVSWNSMIAGYAQHGNGEKALQVFEKMQQAGMMPDHITFVGVLSACSNVGLVDKGRSYFNSMAREHNITPCLEHYTCMVDLLGRAGLLDEADKIIREMPVKPDALVWRTLLSACKIHGNMKLGERAAECILELEKKNASTYVLLSNIYAAIGRWDSVERVRKMMEDRGVKKEPGCSWIEVHKTVHTFITRDRSHPQTEEIYAKLKELTLRMKEAGYVPNTKLLRHHVDDEQKDQFLCYHSEQLAVAFGLISAPFGMPIRVLMNLSVCGDCHAAIKFISSIADREIIVRDTNRFHHFKDGLCSCGEYW